MQTPTGTTPSDVSTFCEDTQWSVQQEYGRQGSTATFVLTAPTGYSFAGSKDTALTLLVKPMSTIALIDTSTGALIYAGIIQQPYLVFLSATIIQYWVQCVDFTYMVDSALVSYSPGPLPGDQIVKNLIYNANGGGGTAETSNLGVQPGAVSSAPTISGFQSNYLQLTDAWDQVGNLVSWQNDYNWQVAASLVDDWETQLEGGASIADILNVVVNWQTEQDIVNSAVAANGGGPLFTDDLSDLVGNVMTADVGLIDISQMFQYIWDGSSLRNQCVVQGANITKTTTDTWQGDGVTSQFQLTYDLDGSVDATLTIGGEAASVSVVTDVATATSDYCLVQSTINGTWSLVNGVDGPPGAGQTISLAYTYNVPITVSVPSSASQAQYDNPYNKGVFAVYLSDSTLTTNSMAYQRAAAEVNQYCYVLETFTFTTAEGWPGHVDVGDCITISTQFIPDAYNDWDVGINDQYVVIRNNIQGTQVGRRQYQITAVRYQGLNNLSQ